MKVLACIVLSLAVATHAIDVSNHKEGQEKRGVIGYGYGPYTAPGLASYAAPIPLGKTITLASPALAYTTPAKYTYAAPALPYPPALNYATAPALTYATAPAYPYVGAPGYSYAPAPAVAYAAAPALTYAAAPAITKVAYATPGGYTQQTLPYAAAPVGYGYGLGYGAKYIH